MAGGSQILINDQGITISTHGKIVFQASRHSVEGPAKAMFDMPQLPTSPIAPTDLEFRRVYADGRPIVDLPFTAHLADGTVKKGKTDASGIGRIDGVHAGSAKITYERDRNPPAASVQIEADDDFKQLFSIPAKPSPKT